jgi:two-component system NtrC family sensor kinase
MKKNLATVILAISVCSCFAQQTPFFMKNVDSLKRELAIAREDSSRVLIMEELSLRYQSLNADSTIKYGKEGIALANKIQFTRGEIRMLNELAMAMQINGDIPASLELSFKALQMAEEKSYAFETGFSLFTIGNAYWFLKDYDKAISYLKKAETILETVSDEPFLYDIMIVNSTGLGNAYIDINQFDSAYSVLEKTYNATLNNYWHAGVMESFGLLVFKMGDHEKGLEYLRQSIKVSDDLYSRADASRWIAECYAGLNQPDSAIYYAKLGLAASQIFTYQLGILSTSNILAKEYEARDINESYYYLKLFVAANDALYGEKKVLTLQKTIAEEQQRERKAETERIANENQLKQAAFLTGLGILIFIAFILYRNNLRERKAKNLLHEKNKVIEQTLTNLRSTQSQLIQSEKMASLGELTAGIAHEIQNPLNFVNNFSEVNKELIEELRIKNEELKIEDNEVNELLNDLADNEEKINHHGKRADAIVKGMLQHSKRSEGKKEPTDINALCDEYLRLSYHGLRAKDKDFNATMKTDFDESIGNINIIPQDIGRVLLNLYNNAFYAVDEKKKQQTENYEPTVTIKTKKSEGKIEVSVKDNGNGIPQKVVDKIFQPFFTTKPTGQGTGLGLSLSYDIMKAHGGEIKVETKLDENAGLFDKDEGCVFIIQLPNI